MEYKKKLELVSKLNNEYRYFKSLESLFELEQWNTLPPEGGDYRQHMEAHFLSLKNAVYNSADAKEAAKYFEGADINSIDDYVERGLIRTFLHRYRTASRTPESLIVTQSLARADTIKAWREAREKKDFKIFLPWLELIFSLKKKIAFAIDPESPEHDTLIGLTDEGARCDEIDREFAVLKAGLGDLLSKINNSITRPDHTIMQLEEDRFKMEFFARKLSCETGYDLNRGGFYDRTVHAFTSFIGPKDARISTPIHGSLNLIFTYLHETGHAVYANSGNDRVNDANMWGGIEGGFQEAMARFHENMLGRNRAFCEYYYPLLQHEFSTFRKISLNNFYNGMNAVRPSLTRITADEVTYNLHVILRYEIERDYFSGKLKASELEDRWNELYQKYLGVRPSNPTEGILQDMHWAGDYIGYFQSYALGNIYSGQIFKAVKAAIPDLDSQLSSGNLTPLNDWLTQNIRQYGCCFTSGELAERISGSRLDAQPFLDYLNDKYSLIYHF